MENASEFQIKTYRAEWLTEVYQEDQYGRRENNYETLYQAVWPTREAAITDLGRIAVQDKFGRWKCTDKSIGYNDYCGAGVGYREVLIRAEALGEAHV